MMDDKPIGFANREYFPEDELRSDQDLPYTVEREGELYVVEGPED